MTPSVKDCYAALGIIHQTWSPVPGRIKDFIAMPRPNGYQSLHTSVISERGLPFEVQIRTEEMHRRAEEGIAAHWKYKEGRVGAGRDEQYFQWLRQLLEWQQEVRDPQEFLTNLKIDLYPEEVYTFTPRGQVKVLPDGADAGRLRVRHPHRRRPPLRRRPRQRPDGAAAHAAEERRHRRDHDQPGHKPSRDWLSFVATSRARSKIRHLHPGRGEGRARSTLGRKLLEKEARRFDVDQGAARGEALRKAAPSARAAQGRRPARAVGYGKVCRRARCSTSSCPQGELKEKAPEHPVVSAVKRVLRPGARRDRIKVSGADDLMVFRARCCNPIRGEKIVGYITRGKGVSVHSASCPNVVNLLYDPERRIDVEWDKGGDAAPYTVRLTMQVEDRKGMLARAQRHASPTSTPTS